MSKEQIIAELKRWRYNRLMRGFSAGKKVRLMRLLHFVEMQNNDDRIYVNWLNRLN